MFSTECVSHRGGRDINQDALLEVTAGALHCWVLADGLGGMGGGEVASAAAVDAVRRAFLEVPKTKLNDYLDLANQSIRRRQGDCPEFAAMRTAIVLLISDGVTAQWTHCGDCRLYHFRGGSIANRTLDHSVPQALVAAGRIAASDIRKHPDRNRLLKSLGGAEALDLSVESIDLDSGDAFLLASDGFWDYITESEMEADLAKSIDAAHWLEGMLTRLRTRLLSEVPESADNYSAIAILRS